MALSNCSVPWIITTQADADIFSSQPELCQDGNFHYRSVHIQDATENITISGDRPIIDTITVTGGNGVRSLNLSINSISRLELNDALGLYELYLPIYIPEVHIKLENSGKYFITLLEVYGLSRVVNLTMDSCVMSFSNLDHIDSINLKESTITLGNESEVYDVTLTDMIPLFNYPIRGNLNIKNPRSNVDTGLRGDEDPQNPSIGGNMSIDGASFIPLSYPGLTRIGGSLELTNNTNCTLSFNNLTEASNVLMTKNKNTTLVSSISTIGSNLEVTNNSDCDLSFRGLKTVSGIFMEGNTNTTLPGSLDSLERADSIHLKGIIDTSNGPNIFPSLRLVRDLTIEAWNADFNCSKLVSQMNEGVINHLFCNGTDNGNSTTTVSPIPSDTTPPATSSNDRLPQGSRTGIGISASVVFLALVGVSIYFWRRKRTQPRQHLKSIPEPTEPQLDSNEIHEAEDNWVLRPPPWPLEANAIRSPVEAYAIPSPVEMDVPRVERNSAGLFI